MTKWAAKSPSRTSRTGYYAPLNFPKRTYKADMNC